MNNQHILKFIVAAKASKGYFIKQKKEEAEIKNLYNRGYFNPPEYNDYIARNVDYKYMIDLFAERMNDMYYFNYVEQQYLLGYMRDSDFDDYEMEFIMFYYDGEISYDFYIRKLEIALRKINSNY